MSLNTKVSLSGCIKMSVPSALTSLSCLKLLFYGIDAKVAAIGFLSWNVKGVNGRVKRARIFKHHLLVKDQVILKKGRVGKAPTLVPKHAEQP